MSVLFFNFSFCSAKEECISLDTGQCAWYRDGTPQKCTTKDGDNGLCLESKGFCKCVKEPENCLEYQELLLEGECYECDGSRLGCPIGKIVELNYGTISGQIYCCCTEQDKKSNVKKKSGEKEGETGEVHVIDSDGNTKGAP